MTEGISANKAARQLTAAEVGFCSGLLFAQRSANEASHAAHHAGQHDVANALAELSTDLLLAREHVETKDVEPITDDQIRDEEAQVRGDG